MALKLFVLTCYLLGFSIVLTQADLEERDILPSIAADLKAIQDAKPTTTIQTFPQATSALSRSFANPNDILGSVVSLIENGFDPNDIQSIVNGFSAAENYFNNVNPQIPSRDIYPKASPNDATYSLPEAALKAAIYIPPIFTYRKKPPVVLFPGTAVPAGETFACTYGRVLANTTVADPLWVNIPGSSLADAQVTAEYAAYAMNYIQGITNRNISIVTFSRHKAKRDTIHSGCLKYQGRILSLTSFMEDTKLLAASCEAMKLLLPKPSKSSMRVSFRNHFNACSTMPEAINNFDNLYRRIWLYAWQNFPQLIGSRVFCLRKGHRKTGPQMSPTKIADFKNLFVKLGFNNNSDESVHASANGTSPYLAQSIESFLRSLSQDRLYQRLDIAAAVRAISPNVEEFLQTTQPKHIEEARLTQNLSQLRLVDRMGLPNEVSFDDDRTLMVMHSVYSERVPTSKKKYVSSFAIIMVPAAIEHRRAVAGWSRVKPGRCKAQHP